MKNFIYKISIFVVFIASIPNGVVYGQANDNNYLLIRELASDLIRSNNGLLKGIIVLLVILIFGYSAKLFYEKKFGKE